MCSNQSFDRTELWLYLHYVGTDVVNCCLFMFVMNHWQNCIYFLCVICCLFTGQKCDCIHFLLAQMWWTAVCSAEPSNPWKLSAHPSHAGPQVIYSKTVCKRLLQCDKLEQLGMVFVVVWFPPTPLHFCGTWKPKGRLGMSDMFPLSEILGSSLDSPSYFLSFFCLNIFLLMVHSADFCPENSLFFFFS